MKIYNSPFQKDEHSFWDFIKPSFLLEEEYITIYFKGQENSKFSLCSKNRYLMHTSSITISLCLVAKFSFLFTIFCFSALWRVCLSVFWHTRLPVIQFVGFFSKSFFNFQNLGPFPDPVWWTTPVPNYSGGQISIHFRGWEGWAKKNSLSYCI